MGRASARIAIDYLQHGDANLQALVSDVKTQSGAEYCAILADTGVYLAHSDTQLAGQTAVEPDGAAERWGASLRVQYLNAQGTLMDEYRAPLEAGGRPLGTLVLGVARPGLWGYVLGATQHAPLVIFGPACFMALGAVLLNRMVRPVADIEQQLSRVAMSASVDSCELSEVAALGAAALGWNRVITQFYLAGPLEQLVYLKHQ